MNAFGPTLKAWREKRGFSLRKFSELIDKSTGFLSELEGGLRQPQDLNLVEKIEEVLEIPDHELLLLVLKERKTAPSNIFRILRGRPNLQAAVSQLSEQSEEEVGEMIEEGVFYRRKRK
jgi:transcriptional regulator with XRE-family HTH domain